MRRKYKNELFQLLLSSKFGIDTFEINENQSVESLMADIILVKDTPFYFTIRNSDDDFESFDYQFVKYVPDFSLSDIYPPQGFVNFESIINALNYWLNNTLAPYLEDQQEPDLWEEFKHGNNSLNLNEIDFDNRSSFSIEEKKQIELSLNELKLLIHTNLDTSKAEQDIINSRLDYLIEASERLNKFDWKSLALSSLISISIALSLDTQKGHLLFELFRKVFSVIPMLIK